MLRSMTAYGRGSVENKEGKFIAEIVSVNRRYLEIQLNIPKELLFLSHDIRKWIKKEIERGRVDLFLEVNYADFLPMRLNPNLSFVREVKRGWGQIAEELQIKDKLPLDFLVHDSRVFLAQSEPLPSSQSYRQILFQVVSLALKELKKMKEKEGKALEEDIRKRLNKVKKGIERIDGKLPKCFQELKKRLQEKLKEFLPKEREEKKQFLRELFLYVEKFDVTEEMIRIKSHLSQLFLLLNTKMKSIGKKFDFILQELFRELNTITAKLHEVEIVKIVLECKAEVEKIREQVQNIE